MTEAWIDADAEDENAPLTAGIELARQRLRRHSVDIDPADLSGVIELARSTLREQVPGAPARAQEFIAEAVMLAGAIRRYYGEPDPQADEVARYVDAAQTFFNSFWHE